jgi:hypothetical protein
MRKSELERMVRRMVEESLRSTKIIEERKKKFNNKAYDVDTPTMDMELYNIDEKSNGEYLFTIQVHSDDGSDTVELGLLYDPEAEDFKLSFINDFGAPKEFVDNVKDAWVKGSLGKRKMKAYFKDVIEVL